VLHNKLIDILQFREGTEDDDEGGTQPVMTTGSIVWGVILRASIIIFLSFFLLEWFVSYKMWWVALFAVWLGAAYPAYRQYQVFKKRVQEVEDETLCGKCKHFDPTSQLCRIYDEHVTATYIPCEGLSWEPKNFEGEDN
jgi:hypothetical protein